MFLAQPHDLYSGHMVTSDILPNVDAVLNQIHQMDRNGYYLGVNGQWSYHNNNCQCFDEEAVAPFTTFEWMLTGCILFNHVSVISAINIKLELRKKVSYREN